MANAEKLLLYMKVMDETYEDQPFYGFTLREFRGQFTYFPRRDASDRLEHEVTSPWRGSGRPVARLPRVVVPVLPHHVTKRGNRRQRTFFGDEDDAEYR